MSTAACDVLVVGAGPTGSTLALLLARQGVDVLLVDREAAIYPLPRAAHIDHEAVRIFQSLGLAGAVMASSRQAPRYDFVNKAGEVLMRLDGADRIGPGGWPAANMIHQPSIERVLRAAVAAEQGIMLRTGCMLAGLEQQPEGVLARLETPDGAADVQARFVVGADGARSATRTLAGIGQDDLRFDEPWLVVDTIVRDPSRLPAVNLQVCDPARPTTCVLMGSGRHRWEFMLLPGETAEQVTEPAFVNALLAPWNVDGAVEIERLAVYRFGARLATRWREGRVLLAGDAAHQMPPFAGQGMCSGLRDAANLAWKLAAVLAGQAGVALLDSYQAEREPHVRGIMELAIMMGRTVCEIDPAVAAARDAQMIAARAAGGTDLRPPMHRMDAGCLLAGAPAAGAYFPQWIAGDDRLDDRLGGGAWLITRDPADAAALGGIHVIALADPALAPFAGDLRDWLDAHGTDAVLVRPDRYVFGAGRAPDLLAAYPRARNVREPAQA